MEELAQRPPRQPLVPPGGINCHVTDMTATVSADTTLADFQSALAPHNQWLPIDGDPNQTIGTLVSCDSTGPLRLGYGAWRDLLLGAQFLNGRGELITAGGRTVKNVAGYDLTKFIVGQRGVFAKLITLTTRTYRRPGGALLARFAPDVTIVSRFIPQSLRPHWAVLTAKDLLLGYLGDSATLAFYRGKLTEAGAVKIIERSLNDDIQHRNSLWNADGAIAFRASVPPARLNEVAAKLRLSDPAPSDLCGAALPGCGSPEGLHHNNTDSVPVSPNSICWCADAAFGIVVSSIASPSESELVRKMTGDLDGTIKLFRGRFGPALSLSTTPAERQIIERLKFAFDPDNTLSPLPWQSK